MTEQGQQFWAIQLQSYVKDTMGCKMESTQPAQPLPPIQPTFQFLVQVGEQWGELWLSQPGVIATLKSLSTIIRFTIIMIISQLPQMTYAWRLGLTLMLFLYILKINTLTIDRIYPRRGVYLIFCTIQLILNTIIYSQIVWKFQFDFNTALVIMVYSHSFYEDYMFVSSVMRRLYSIWQYIMMIGQIRGPQPIQDVCPICREDMTEGFSLGCEHCYHQKCLKDYIWSGGLHCPMCRKVY